MNINSAKFSNKWLNKKIFEFVFNKNKKVSRWDDFGLFVEVPIRLKLEVKTIAQALLRLD
jgi:hypothetical protein